MPQCAAWGCNTRPGKGVPVHRFPKDLLVRKKWLQKVGETRADFSRRKVTPYTILCSKHFTDGDYVTPPSLTQSFGLTVKPSLHAWAVPSIFPKPRPNSKPSKSRTSRAVAKRHVLELKHRTPGSDDTNDFNDGETPGTSAVACQEPQSEQPVTATCMGPQTTNSSTQTYRENVSDKWIQVWPKLVRASRDKGTQTVTTNPVPVSVDCEVQCNILVAGDESAPSEDDAESVAEEDDLNADPSWLPGEEGDADIAEDSDDDEQDKDMNRILHSETPPLQQQKFLVYESCLLELLRVCITCYRECSVCLVSSRGSCVTMEATCSQGHSRRWTSQPLLGSLPCGNIETAAAILFTGSTCAKGLSTLRFMGMSTMSSRTFLRIQRFYLIPAIFELWDQRQREWLKELQRQKAVRLGGDARCDSMRNAKYGSYSVMDLRTGLLVDVQLVQRNEVSSSAAMELEGLKRSLTKLLHSKIDIDTMVTDRHVGVKSYLKKTLTNIHHLFDIWHVAKSLQKKLKAASKRRDCKVISLWISSIVRHLYFSVTSSGGDSELAVVKWKSILNHVTDIHIHDDDKFPTCEHNPITEPREWLKSGSKAYKELAAVVCAKSLLRDVGQLSPYEQTGSVESYHRVVTFFAPKMLHFFYAAMKARTLLSALHFNENAQRQCAVDAEGNKRYSVSFQRFQSDKPVAKEEKVPCTFDN